LCYQADIFRADAILAWLEMSNESLQNNSEKEKDQDNSDSHDDYSD
jgi:hypothetical protein